MRWICPEVVRVRLDNLDTIPEVKAVSGIVILSISGSGMVSRPVSDDDPFLSRLKMNSSLVWTQYDGHVCYMPSAVVEQIKARLNNCFIAGTAVGVTEEESYGAALHLKEENSDVKKMALSAQSRIFLMKHLYRKLRLPVLLFWLLVLVVNFLLSSHLGEALNAEYQLKRQDETMQRTRQETTSRQKQLMDDYQGLILPKSSVAFDRIASVLPEGMRLDLLECSGHHTISVSGNALEMSQILMCTESLREVFDAVEIRSLETRKNGPGYCFDLKIGL